jgi:enterochelin esterase-like enzyme
MRRNSAFHAIMSFIAAALAAQGAPLQGEAKPQWITPAVAAPRLQHRTFQSAAAKTRVSYFIYTPEIYDQEKERRFPVLYWLHGTGGGLSGVAYLTGWFDAAVREGKTPAMLVVFPNGMKSSMWCDSKDGSVPMETVVMKELVPHIDATFRTVASRRGRLIEGFSMGGYGAARLGFKHHDLFGAVSILAAGPLDLELRGPRAMALPREREEILKTVYGGDLDYFRAQSPLVLAEQFAAAVRDRTLVRQAVGDRDSTLALNRAFHEHLTRLGIPHAFDLLPGVGHSPKTVLEALGERNWRFYHSVFGTLPAAGR